MNSTLLRNLRKYLLLSMASGLLLAGCSQSPYDKARTSFMDGCKDSGGTKAICACAFSQLEHHYSRERLIQIFTDPAQTPPDFMDEGIDAIRQCASRS
jgi:hypothetical protein